MDKFQILTPECSKQEGNGKGEDERQRGKTKEAGRKGKGRGGKLGTAECRTGLLIG